jgi:hypothetical protein
MRKCPTATLCLAALLFGAPALHAEEAFNPRGQWLVTNGQPSYSGVVLIDAEWRATWESVWDPTKYPAVTDNNTGRASGRGYAPGQGSPPACRRRPCS